MVPIKALACLSGGFTCKGRTKRKKKGSLFLLLPAAGPPKLCFALASRRCTCTAERAGTAHVCPLPPTGFAPHERGLFRPAGRRQLVGSSQAACGSVVEFAWKTSGIWPG
ncbi:hypothetical protein BS78_01G067000 [Paspalum vaginatum]|nr:hypothetical protein BS78_01G067000 [Paspalum vaginatum]